VSGLREIIEWVQREVILNPESTPDREFESISRIFKRDRRSALADILRDDTPEFLEFLESELSRERAKPETDEEAEPAQRGADIIERSLEDLLQGAENLLGTPIRLFDEIVRPIERPIRLAVKKTGIIDTVKGFFRSLFS